MLICSKRTGCRVTLHEALPGVRPWLYCAHWAPPWAHLAKYLRTRLRPSGRVGTTQETNKKHTTFVVCLLFGIRQCPTLPGRLQPSTIGAERLNFCVRYGNRWDPFAITTGILLGLCTLKTAHPDFFSSREKPILSIFPLVSLVLSDLFKIKSSTD